MSSASRIYLHLALYSKASASVLAVDERQSLETLSRDEKTTARTLSQLKDKLEQQTQKREKLAEEERTLSQKKSEVYPFLGSTRACVLNKCRPAGRQSLRASSRPQAREAGAR